MTRGSRRRPALRGIVTRFLSALLGAIVASAIIVSIQLPLVHEPPTVRLALNSYDSFDFTPPPLAWPSQGSAALEVPALDVTLAWHDHVVPIASLTKMMTVYVVLQRLPLTVGETGPCVVVTANDVLDFHYDKSRHIASAIVVPGERLCEIDLLNGALVHSAANYADMLASMVSSSPTAFVTAMNAAARSLGLRHTHYADDAGLSDLSVSTALDQARLARMLMRSPLVRSIVDQSTVDLPVAGVVNSFTPLVGTNGVVGVKSGRTSAAGGCDAMAVAYRLNGREHLVFAVVLSQRVGDVLATAGAAALALALSAESSQVDVALAKGAVVGTVSYGSRAVPFGLAEASHVYWWDQHNRHPLVVRLRRLGATIHRGEVVGWIEVHGVERPIPLVAFGTVAEPTLWRRIL